MCKIIFLIILILFLFFILDNYIFSNNIDKFNNVSSNYIDTLKKHKENNKIFPYRLLCDENNNILPIVALSAFMRTDYDRERYTEYIKNGIKIIGITAYKTFPKPISDNSADNTTVDDKFNYTSEIKNWLTCFKNPEEYNFTSFNNIINISESDFYDIETVSSRNIEKKYDIIYSCLQDDDKSCPMTGWNAINRNFKLALDCLPILINEYKLKVLIIGRMNCGLEEKYGNNITVVNMLPYHEFQQKMRESKFLFIPNIYDASPRVISEALIKDIPVLMNRNIVCGSKYINYNTGEFFTDENDIRLALNLLLKKYNDISPRDWFKENYGKKISGKKFRDFLYQYYPEILGSVKEIYFS